MTKGAKGYKSKAGKGRSSSSATIGLRKKENAAPRGKARTTVWLPRTNRPTMSQYSKGMRATHNTRRKRL